jgi:WD40 repeat protein
MPPLPPIDMQSPVRQLGFDLPNIESPSPLRPPLGLRHHSIEMPAAPRLGHLEAIDSPPVAGPSTLPEERTPRSSRLEEPQGLLEPAAISPRRMRPRSLPLPSLVRPPPTTISFSPAPPFEAPTDSTWQRNQPGPATPTQAFTGDVPAPPAPQSPTATTLSTNPFGTATTRTDARRDFSYQNEFKRAYLTDSNWLKGPGKVLSTQQAADDGVVTSLCFDEEYIAVGMATNEVHLFDAVDGSYARSLQGHGLGVWSVVLVSKSAAPAASASSSKAASASMAQSGSAGPSTFRSPANPADSPTTPSRPRNPRRPSSFGSARDFQSAGWQMPPAGKNSSDFLAQQGSICGTAKGWGQPGAVVVSGGCDRIICVWDADTG